MPGDNQPDRKPAERRGAPDSQCEVWRDQGMVGRWVASAWLLTENRFRKISGHRDLWVLATILGRKTETESLAEESSII